MLASLKCSLLQWFPTTFLDVLHVVTCCSDGIWPGVKTVLVSAVLVLSSTGQRATVQRESGLQSDFLSPSPHSGGVKFLEAGQRGTDNPLSTPDCPV